MTASLSVVFEARAARDVETIDRWWRTNRRAAPDMFLSELEVMTGAISMMPSIGPLARDARVHGVRRALLRRSRHNVYDRVRGGTLHVLAIWHTSRGSSPAV